MPRCLPWHAKLDFFESGSIVMQPTHVLRSSVLSDGGLLLLVLLEGVRLLPGVAQ
jgi:hypothetical protein